MKIKKAGITDNGEARERFHLMLNSRLETEHELNDLFADAAKAMRRGDRAYVAKKFVQAPAVITQAPNLARSLSEGLKEKMASVKEKTAIIGPAVDVATLGIPSAVGYVAGRNEGRTMAREGIEPQNGIVGDAAKFLLLPGATGYMIGKRSGYNEAKASKHKKEKKASIAPNVDAFFTDARNYVDEAVVRFPELLKVAAKTTPVAKKQPGTTVSGPTPVRSAVSGGSA